MVDWDEILYLNQELIKADIDSNRDEVETMEIVLGHRKCRKYLLNFLQTMPKVSMKNEDSAKKYRTKANVLFVAGNVHGAIELYTKAICCAGGQGTLELGLAHANRGLALMKVHRFADAYQDCKVAIDANYPVDKLVKVLLRKATCSVELKKSGELSVDLEDIERYAAVHRLGAKDTEIWTDLQQKLTELSKSDGQQGGVVSSVNQPPPRVQELRDPNKGRYVVAQSDIVENELIRSEQAFVFVPVYEERQVISNDCQSCAAVNIIPFPCDDCKLASYCSPACRQQHVAIHALECRGYRINLWAQIGIAHLAARAFTVGLDQIVAAVGERTFDSAQAIFRYLSSDFENDERFSYGKVFSLVTNFKKMSLENYSCYVVTALLLTVYFQSFTNLFPDSLKSMLASTQSQEAFVGALILRNIGQLVCNGHAITSIRTTLPSIENCYNSDYRVARGFLHVFLRIVRAFTGIFPNISMLNHSCSPNIRNRMDQDRLEIYATAPIRAGEEIFNCYGPHYQQQSGAERRQLLREQYLFDCDCVQCRNGDEDCNYSQFVCQSPNCRKSIWVEGVKSFLEYSKKVRCRHCDKSFSLKFARNLEKHLADENWIELLQCYRASAGFLNKSSDYNLNFLFAILNQFVPEVGVFALSLKNNVDYLIELAVELAQIRASQFGISSLEYVKDSTYLLDLLALKAVTENETNVDDNVVRTLADLRKSLIILPDSIRGIYVSYMDDYLLK